MGIFKLDSRQFYCLKPYIFKELSSQKFLVDTGASVLVFPHILCHPHVLSVGVQLRTAKGTAMNTFGSRQIAFQFGPCRFEWSFLLADVFMPILGSDFLPHHQLFVDIAGSHLLDASTLEPCLVCCKVINHR